jgi:predicted Fe-S protein YdhL (DUF1289 family)
MEDVASPCVRVCEMDTASGLCRGCLRTIREIALWSELSPVQRHAVLARLPARRVMLDASPCQP